MRVLVGAPVHERGWVLPHYFEALRAQGMDLEFLFNLGPGEDTTEQVLAREQTQGGWARFEILLDDFGDHHAKRLWYMKRYETMVRLRNDLLKRVRELEPDYYLSLDTDILLPPGAIRTLVQELERVGADGISPLLYMTDSGTRYPNAMRLDRTERVLPTDNTTQTVPVAFAAKLMTPALYREVDYAAHPSGEDLGWGVAAAQAGFTLAWAPQVKAKHVMNPAMLQRVDPRVGF